MPSPFLDAHELRTATFVRHVELHESLASTNDRAAQLARARTIELPALVAARLQSAGRGRGSTKWWSAEGALTFSVLLDSSAMGISMQDWPRLSLATAVAICDAIAAEAPQTSPALKWPNDVFINRGKVCGILIESPGGAKAKNRLVIGVGINVNNSWRNAPASVGQRGTALCDVTASKHSLQSILGRSLQSMERRFEQLARNDADLPRAWQRLSWLTGQEIEVQTTDDRIIGTCVGISEEGALLIENANGTHDIRNGSVSVI
jgi:BirA family biotin operon repressor/biotin-[acetyl-CoA-carboxylase] ligase